MIVDYILTPSSEGAQRATSKLIVESTIVFELAGVCLAHIVFRTKPHKLIGEHFIESNYAAQSILCSTPHWLIVENILPGARVIPNISCEEPHGLIVTNNVPPNFERELAFDDKASFDTSKVFSKKSKLIVDSIPSSEGAQRAASKLIFDFVIHHELIKLINGLVSHIELTELISRVLDGHMNYFQQGAASHFNDACIHRLIVVSVSEGARQVAPAQLAASSTILKLIDALISEGARFDSNLYQPGNLDSSQLIVYIISAKRASQLIVIYSKITLRFSDRIETTYWPRWPHQLRRPQLLWRQWPR